MKLSKKDYLEIYELNKKYNKEKRKVKYMLNKLGYLTDDYINNLCGKKNK